MPYQLWSARDSRPRGAATVGPVADRSMDIECSVRNSQRATTSASSAPASCAMMNPVTSAGRIPENVFDSERAIVIAGLAKDVEAVDQ